MATIRVSADYHRSAGMVARLLIDADLECGEGAGAASLKSVGSGKEGTWAIGGKGHKGDKERMRHSRIIGKTQNGAHPCSSGNWVWSRSLLDRQRRSK
jgi:hypothetical protein